MVDDEAARAAAGGVFAAPVPQKDRDATRHNMLGAKLLDAAGQDTMSLTAESVTGGPGNFEAEVRVSLAGRESVVAAPFTVTIDGDRLEAHAVLRLTHADLGLEPFTVALGALRVRDDFDVDLTLEAEARLVTGDPVPQSRGPDVRGARGRRGLGARSGRHAARRCSPSLGEQGLLVFCGVLAAPFLLPVTVPGMSTVLGTADAADRVSR